LLSRKYGFRKSDRTRPKTVGIASALFLESFEHTMTSAGLLTYSRFGTPSRPSAFLNGKRRNSGMSSIRNFFPTKTADSYNGRVFFRFGVYSSGTVQDFHLIPFSSAHKDYVQRNQNRCKVKTFFGIKQIYFEEKFSRGHNRRWIKACFYMRTSLWNRLFDMESKRTEIRFAYMSPFAV
jgi:hypothetical protein